MAAHGNLWLRAVRNKSDIEWCLQDQGPGVPEEELQRIFEPFVQVDDARTHGNYGIGLAMVKRIVQLHGGSIKAENCHPGLRVAITMPSCIQNDSSV